MTSKDPLSRDKAEQSEIRNNSTEIKCPIATSSKWMSKWNEQHCKKIKSLAMKVQQTPLVQTETIISANRNHLWFKYPQLRKSPILQFRVKSLWMRTSFLLPWLVQGRVGDLGKVKETWGEVCWGFREEFTGDGDNTIQWFFSGMQDYITNSRAGPPPWAWLLLVVFERILICRANLKSAPILRGKKGQRNENQQWTVSKDDKDK